jgi:phospholipid/cholesterol/gamma-HCH transport system substrate-binding protein
MRRVNSSGANDAQRKRSYRRAAAISLLALVLLTVAVFVKRDPFAHGFEFRADFSSVAELSNGSDVRIAGIDVGQVVGIGPGPRDTSAVTISISSQGLPIRTDATLTIKPRLILEGNAYVDLDPGTPQAPALRSGSTIPIAQTAISVQVDQALDVLNQPTRDAMQRLVSSLASGFGGSAKRLGSNAPGYLALRTDVHQLDGALTAITNVARAAQGTRPGDLDGAINGTGNITAQLAENPAALADFVSSYDHVVGALASQDQALSSSVQQVDGLLRIAPGPLGALDAALPKLTSFADRLRPALRVAPSSFTRTNELLDRLAALVRPPALPALLTDLSPVLGDLPTLEREVHTLFSYSLPVTNCLSTHVVPTLNMKIQDGSNTTGDPVYLDMLHLFTGLTSLASAVDGNGGTLRLGITTGDRIVDTVFPGLGQVVGRIPDVDGVRPTWLGYGVDPPFRPDQPCAAQRLPELNVPAGPVPEWASGNSLASADARTGH